MPPVDLRLYEDNDVFYLAPDSFNVSRGAGGVGGSGVGGRLAVDPPAVDPDPQAARLRSLRAAERQRRRVARVRRRFARLGSQ